MKNQINQLNPSEFRELAPETFWGGKVKINDINSFEEGAKEAAKETGFTYSGFIIGDEYVMTRYPRRAFGPVASVETYQNALDVLADKLGVDGKEEKFNDDLKFRVLLGLEEGYAEHKKKGLLEKMKGENFDTNQIKSDVLELFGESAKKNAITQMSKDDLNTLLAETDLSKKHSVEEVSNILGEQFDLQSAQIYTVGTWGSYQEPAVLIVGSKENKKEVYKLAEDFHQARIALEDLEKKEAYMVETKYCEDPDKE